MSEDRHYIGSQRHAASLGHRDDVYHIYYGPVRSGKTEAAFVGFVSWAQQNPGEAYLISMPTHEQIDAIYGPLFHWITGGQVEDRGGYFEAFGSRFYKRGASSKTAIGRLRGRTFKGALLDEITEFQDGQAFVQEVETRVSRDPGKIVMLTNPEGPNHWFKTEYIDKERDDVDLRKFTLEDNPSLTIEYKERLHNRLTGPFLLRQYYGEWAAATGAIFPSFTVGTPPPLKDLHARYLAFDVARSGVTHALLVGQFVNPSEDWVLAEWRYDGREESVLTPEQQCDRIAKELVGDAPIRMGIGDPSAPDFILAMQQRLGIPVRGAYNDVLLGIQQTAHYLEGNHLKIAKSCGHLIREMENYTWDTKAQEQGEDKPVKMDDHGPDALRYYCITTANMPGSSIKVNMPKEQSNERLQPTHAA